MAGSPTAADGNAVRYYACTAPTDSVGAYTDAALLVATTGAGFGCASDTPASESLHTATTSSHSTVPPPIALLFIRMLSSNILTGSSNLCTNAWYTLAAGALTARLA